MSDYNRGPYTQGAEPPLAFEDRRRPRGGGPAPVTLILSLLLLTAVGGGVYYMYRGGVRAPGEPPQPIGAPVRDVKVAAPPQAPAQDPTANLSIYKENQGDSVAAPAFVAPPEQPTPRPGAPAPGAPVAGAPASPPVTAPAAVAPAPAARPVTIDKILADSSDVKPPARSLATAAVKPAAAAPKPDAASGAAVVQIGAFSSKALADAGWDDAAATAPGAMAGKGKHVVPLTKADGSILYRTSITGFASRAEAEALCARLKAAGGACFVR
jgi:cell division septation protein DedD